VRRSLRSRDYRASRMVLRFVESASGPLVENSGFRYHATSFRDRAADFSRTSVTSRCTTTNDVDQATTNGRIEFRATVSDFYQPLHRRVLFFAGPRSFANASEPPGCSLLSAAERSGRKYFSSERKLHARSIFFPTASRVGARRPMVQPGLYDARLRPFFHGRCKRVAPSGDSNINRTIDDRGR